uniref:Uncharacterized protein n=1 Tax=Rhizophora mucronata TaxID=61149 RepID=A0A2P2QA42_RHIMU
MPNVDFLEMLGPYLMRCIVLILSHGQL